MTNYNKLTIYCLKTTYIENVVFAVREPASNGESSFRSSPDDPSEHERPDGNPDSSPHPWQQWSRQVQGEVVRLPSLWKAILRRQQAEEPRGRKARNEGRPMERRWAGGRHCCQGATSPLRISGEFLVDLSYQQTLLSRCSRSSQSTQPGCDSSA